jgi:hypothetical protein
MCWLTLLLPACLPVPSSTDHDFRISRDDLLRYGNHSLTYRIVDRIFGQVRCCWCCCWCGWCCTVDHRWLDATAL